MILFMILYLEFIMYKGEYRFKKLSLDVQIIEVMYLILYFYKYIVL